LNKIVEQMNKNIKIQSKIASFSHFGWQLWGPHPKIRTQKKHKKTYFGRIKPYYTHIYPVLNPYSDIITTPGFVIKPY
jgi:hypothetical protein